MGIETAGLHLWKSIGRCTREGAASQWPSSVTPIRCHARQISRTSYKPGSLRGVIRTSSAYITPRPSFSFSSQPLTLPVSNTRVSVLQRRQFWSRKKAAETATIDESEATAVEQLEKQDPPRISFYANATGQAARVHRLDELADLSSALKRMTARPDLQDSHASPQRPSWLDLTNPTRAEIEELSRALSLHPLTTEDILGRETQEKVEVHPDYSFVSYTAFDPDRLSSTFLKAVNVYILSFPQGTVSLRSQPLHLLEHMEKRLDRLKGSSTLTSDWITYALIDEVTDSFAPAIKPIQVHIEEMSESLMSGQDPSTLLKRIAGARKKVMTLRRLLGNKTEVVKSLIKRHNQGPGLPHSEMSLNLSDVHDHLIAVSQELNHWEEVIAHSENNCLMQLNLQMTQANNDASEAISKLTVLSTVILPLNVITGLWGMNVMVPGQGVESLHWFGSLATAMLVVACTGYWWATRLFGRRRKKQQQ